jgi:hypothetical protein
VARIRRARELRLLAANAGGDLDNGRTGEFHGFPVVSNALLRLSLTGCDADRNPQCTQNEPDTAAANAATFGNATYPKTEAPRSLRPSASRPPLRRS